MVEINKDSDEVRASCTWGEGPDVLLIIKSRELMLYEAPYHHKPPKGDSTHGFIRNGSLCLTALEARKLAHELNKSARGAEELDRLCKEHDEQGENRP